MAKTKGPNAIDAHVGSQLRMRRIERGMSQEVVVAHTTRARGRAIKPLEPRGSAGFVVADTPRAARGFCWEMQPLPLFEFNRRLPNLFPALSVRKGLWPWPTRKDRRHPERQSPALLVSPATASSSGRRIPLRPPTLDGAFFTLWPFA